MKITKLEKGPETELESETEDSFEIQLTASFLTPKSRRRGRRGEEGMAGEEQSSGLNSRRSSLVSMLQR